MYKRTEWDDIAKTLNQSSLLGKKFAKIKLWWHLHDLSQK